MSRYRIARRCFAPLLLAALAACGAAPQSAIPTAPAAAALATVAPLVTVAPAPTAAPATATDAASAALVVDTPSPAQETSMPSDKPKPTPSSPPPARTSLVRPTPAVERLPTADAAAAVTGEVPQALLDTIIADAALRSAVDRTLIVVQVGRAVEWSDGALGCAKPGMNYLQVITPGYQVVLQAGAATYDYRADERGRFVLCEPGR